MTFKRAWSWFKINNLKILFSIWCLQSSKLHVLLLFQMVSHNLRVNRQIMCRALNSLLNTGNLRAWGLNKMTADQHRWYDGTSFISCWQLCTGNTCSTVVYPAMTGYDFTEIEKKNQKNWNVLFTYINIT